MINQKHLVLMMISNSLTPVKAFLSRPPKMWPRNFTLQNYRQIFAMPLVPRWALNTVMIVCVAVSCAMIVNGAAGYVFAYGKFRFLKPAFALALLPIFCTSYVMIIPRFVIVNRLGLNGTAAVILIGIYWLADFHPVRRSTGWRGHVFPGMCVCIVGI